MNGRRGWERGWMGGFDGRFVLFCLGMGWEGVGAYIYIHLGQVILGWFGFAEDMNFLCWLLLVGWR